VDHQRMCQLIVEHKNDQPEKNCQPLVGHQLQPCLVHLNVTILAVVVDGSLTNADSQSPS